MFTTLMVCLALWGHKGLPAIHLPSRVRSLTQLAQELSAQGVKVQCAAGIGHRLALVCVRERTWENLRPLLERGLETRFALTREGAWMLTADAGVSEREKILREHFIRRYETGVDAIVTPAWNGADALRLLDKPERAQKEKELRDVIGLPNAPGGTPREQAIAGLTLDLARDNMRASLLPLHPLHLAPLLSMPRIHSQHILNAAQDNSEVGLRFRAWVLSTPFAHSPAGVAVDWHDCLRFHPLTFALTEDVKGTLEPYGLLTGGSSLVPGRINLPLFALRDVFTDAGQGETLTASEQATTAWLKQREEDKPVVLEPGERTLSAFVQKWSAQTGCEVIMEVSPHRDVLPGVSAIAPHLALTMTRALQSGHVPEVGEASGGVNIGVENQTAQRYLEVTPDVEQTPLDINLRVWTVTQRDGIALFHNQCAFLDNVAVRNPAAALLLGERRALHEDHLPTFDDLLDAGRLLSLADNRLAGDSSLYVGMGDYADVYPFLRLLDAYKGRESLRKELAEKRVAYLECRHCPLAALTTLTETLRAQAMLAPRNVVGVKIFLPDFPAWLRQGVLEIKTEPSEFGRGVWMTFGLFRAAERQTDGTYSQPESLWSAIVGPLKLH